MSRKRLSLARWREIDREQRASRLPVGAFFRSNAIRFLSCSARRSKPRRMSVGPVHHQIRMDTARSNWASEGGWIGAALRARFARLQSGPQLLQSLQVELRSHYDTRLAGQTQSQGARWRGCFRQQEDFNEELAVSQLRPPEVERCMRHSGPSAERPVRGHAPRRLPSASRSALVATALFAKSASPKLDGRYGEQRNEATVRSEGYLRQGRRATTTERLTGLPLELRIEIDYHDDRNRGARRVSGSVADRKRLFKVTAGNLRNNHLYINGHYDFFPSDCVGGSRRKKGVGRSIQVILDGLNETIETDIGTEARNGKPRRFFRGRRWVRRFFEHHDVKTGDVLAMERVGDRRYHLYCFESRRDRTDDWHQFIEAPPAGKGPIVLELFAGCGGLALGFKRAGFRTALAVEWDKSACESLRHNVTERVAQCAIQEVDRFPVADVIAGGPPCQGFSNLGERVPNDPRNQLWRQYMRAVAEVLPKAFVLENVPPLLKSQEFAEICRMARSLGYDIEGRVLNAADYGVPQTRKRAIVVGVRGGAASFPEPTHVSPQQRDLLTARLPAWRTVRDAIGDLPVDPDERNWHIGRNPTAISLRRYRCVPPGGNRWDLPADIMPECWKRKTKGGTDLFGRLWWDRPSVTIRTEFYKPEKGRYLHPEAHRPITHREAARLQGFPDDFDFQGTRIDVGVQIGNAVPPPLAELIARHLRKLVGAGASRSVRKR